ncbi:MAG TPA: hypothetical protein VKZ49_16920 [Polyangiaceae bacterium]|nr:hypothetical protein [Polyangiaceae bacterium]
MKLVHRISMRTMCVILLALAAVGVGSRDPLLDLAQRGLRSVVEAKIAGELGQPTSVAHVALTAEGLELEGVVLGGAAFAARHVRVRFDWLDLLAPGGPKPRAFGLEGVRAVWHADQGPASGPPPAELVRELADAGIEDVSARDLDLTIRSNGAAVRLSDAVFTAEAEAPGEFDVRLSGALRRGAERAAVTARGNLDPTRLRLDEVVLETDTGASRSSAELRFGGDGSSMALSGSMRLRGRLLHSMLAEVARDLPEGFAFDAASAHVEGSIEGLLLPAGGVTGLGRVELKHVALTLPGPAPKLELSSLALDLARTPAGVRAQRFRATAEGYSAEGSFAPTGEGGAVRLRLRFDDLRALRRVVGQDRILQHLRQAEHPGSKQIEIEGALDVTSEDVWARGTITAKNLRVRPPVGTDDLSFRRASARFDYRRRGGEEALGLSEVDLDGDQGRLRGQARVTPSGQRAELRISKLDARRLGQLVPGGFERGRIDGTLRVQASARRSPVLSGQLALSDALWALPVATEGLPDALSIRQASADIAVDGAKGRLSELRVDAEIGTVEGEIDWSDETHRARLRVVPADVRRFTAALPGVLDGRLELTADLRGTATEPVQEVSGHIALSGGRWSAPPDAPVCLDAVAIHSAAADYRVKGERLVLDRVALDTSVGRAQGRVEHAGVTTRITADLGARDAGRVLNVFPDLQNLVELGHGTARIALTLSPAGLSGRVDGWVRSGRLVLPDVATNTPSRHPVDWATFAYEFQPGWHRVRHLKVRGPELNADLNATWLDEGRVAGSGRLWLTRAYTSKLAGGWGFALRALGYRQINTPFTLSGTSDDTRLDAAAAHGWRWRLLRTGVPDELERIARGEAPLFSAASASGGCSDRASR